MRVFTPFVALLVVIFALIALISSSSFSSMNGGVLALDEEFIRCKVCHRAIEYIWHQGDILRAHCKSPERNDHRCDLSNLHHFGIHELTTEVCKHLPHTHKAVEGSEFDLVLHHDPQHPDDVIDKIYSTCVKWVHHEHGLDAVSTYMFANLDAGKHRDTILHSLQHKFCKNACNPNYKQSRKIESDHITPNAATSHLKRKELNGDL